MSDILLLIIAIPVLGTNKRMQAMCRLLAFCSASLLASCVGHTTDWIKPGMSAASLEADSLQCKYEAKTTTTVARKGDAVTFGDNGLIFVQDDLMNSCMKARGWREKRASAE
jgi:hypothetical protein